MCIQKLDVSQQILVQFIGASFSNTRNTNLVMRWKKIISSVSKCFMF